MSSTPEEDFENAKAICSNLGLPGPTNDQSNQHSERCRAGKQLNPKGCWCSEDSPKSAEEIAQEIVKERIGLDVQYWDGIDHYLAGRIAKALTEYAEARVKEAHNSKTGECATCVSAYKIGREQALEEAAKVAETFKKKGVAHVNCIVDADCEQAGATADAIRALKDSNTDGGTTVEIDAYLDIWRKSKGEI